MTTTTTTSDKPPLVARVLGNNTDSTSSTLTFKILQLADLHFTGNPYHPCCDTPKALQDAATLCTEALMSAFVDEVLDLEKPDLVVFTGDNVQTFAEQDRQRAVDAFTRGVEQRQIPFAVVLGNHDDENGFAREDVLRMAMSKRMSYAQRGPLSVDGVGNYQLSVRAPVGGAWGNASDAVLQLYFLDSGGYPDKSKYPNVDSTYDWIKPSQVAYYRNLSIAAQALQLQQWQQWQQQQSTTMRTSLAPSSAPPAPTPAIMFFHIPLQEYNFAASQSTFVSGKKNEGVSASNVSSELFAALVERDEVKATFCGHDHTNEFCYSRQGIQLCYGGGAGLGVAYGLPKFARRARVIEWTVDDKNDRTIRTWKRLFGDVALRFNEEPLFLQRDGKSVLVSGPAAFPAFASGQSSCVFASHGVFVLAMPMLLGMSIALA